MNIILVIIMLILFFAIPLTACALVDRSRYGGPQNKAEKKEYSHIKIALIIEISLFAIIGFNLEKSLNKIYEERNYAYKQMDLNRNDTSKYRYWQIRYYKLNDEIGRIRQ